jgi:peptidyl-tRNA hydrolase, PTH1 family
MKLIVGLGNPGSKYKFTRHNFGFLLLDAFAEQNNARFTSNKKFKAEITEYSHSEHDKIILAKPQTYMNLSGQSIGPLANFYKISPHDILIVHDDMDLPFGKIRFAQKGRSAGHNGIKSLIECLGSQEFHRLKLGVGRPQHVNQEVVDHVLDRFSKKDVDTVNEVIAESLKGVEYYLDRGIEPTMNAFN